MPTIPGGKNETLKPRGWGHVVLKVRDLRRSERFYTETIGFTVVGRRAGTTYLSLGGPYHDMALYEAGPLALMPGARSLGIVHLAFAVEDETALRRFYAFLKEKKVQILGAVDHVISRSVYVSDPDGYIVELFANVPVDEWNGLPNPFDRERPYDPGGTVEDEEEPP